MWLARVWMCGNAPWVFAHGDVSAIRRLGSVNILTLVRQETRVIMVSFSSNAECCILHVCEKCCSFSTNVLALGRFCCI